MKKERNKNPSSHKELLRIFCEEIKDVVYTADEKKAYFEYLYKLFEETEIDHLPSWEKVEFFWRWFIVISEEYLKAYIKYKLLKKQYGSLEIMEKKAIPFFRTVSELFKFTPAERSMNFYLKRDFSKDFMDRKKQFFGSPYTVTPILPVEKIDFKAKINLDTYPPEQREALRMLLVNVQYPDKVILNEIKEIINKEQEIYYSIYASKKPLFIKKTSNGRYDTYSFVNWIRYLKVYMLKQQGKKNSELLKQFYNRYLEDPKSQLLRDNRKAKKLSKNAVAGNFPGKY